MMKKRNTLTIFFLFSFVAAVFSQIDTTDFLSELDLMSNKNTKRYPSTYITLSYIGWQGLPSNVEYQPNNNRELSFYKLFNLIKESRNFNVALGLSASLQNMHNNVNNWEFDSTGEIKNSQLLPDTLDKHKLSSTYLYVPVELKYRFGKGSKKPPFILAVGGKIGTLVYSVEKTKDGDIKIKERVREGISKINYGTYAYFGYKFVGIIAGYNFSPMFNSDHSPSITNWTLGLALLF